MENKKFDLEDRLVKFACTCLRVCDILPNTKTGQNLHFQLSKSATAPALIYGEAQAAESPADFIHKMKMVLKELKETRINLRIIIEKPLLPEIETAEIFDECNQLVAIFITSIETAKNNRLKK